MLKLVKFSNNKFQKAFGYFNQQLELHRSSRYEYFNQIKVFINDKLLSFLIIRQCSSVAAQRIRRGGQLFILYNNLGCGHTLVGKMIERFVKSLIKNDTRKKISLLLSSALLAFEKEKFISDVEIDCVASEMALYNRENNILKLPDEWENVIHKNYIKIWRKALLNSHLYEYKVCGTYYDIPARAFFDTQINLQFRKQWDRLVISLDVIGCDDDTGSEVVRWVTHFPYPMYSREYIYVRRYKVDKDKKLMVIVNRSVEDDAFIPDESKYVRVKTYMSKMVIKPHTNFDENGFDYVLTYYDDPKANFPKFAYNWMANTGVPDFVDKLHNAAVLLHQMNEKENMQILEESLPM